MSQFDFDVGIIGGDPAGTATAAYQAKAGLSCVVFKRESFSRPHVGKTEQPYKYIAQDVLGGRDIGLDEITPLLEWGSINSLKMIRLPDFMRIQFDIDIPTDSLLPTPLPT
jgi:hypothetical protein